MLLAEEPVEAEDLGYELDAWHVGAVVTSGPDARAAIRDLAAALDRSPLLVQAREGVLWIWLGGRRKITSSEVLRLAESCWPRGSRLVLGEAAQGIGGWRRSHRQAKAAMPIASRSPAPVLRYADVALLAAALGDEMLADLLKDTYMAPLRRERDGGQRMRSTLEAYFESGRNISCAAALLSVNRKTVSLRLQGVERALGVSIDECAAQLETALRLWELEHKPIVDMW